MKSEIVRVSYVVPLCARQLCPLRAPSDTRRQRHHCAQKPIIFNALRRNRMAFHYIEQSACAAHYSASLLHAQSFNLV